MTHEAQDRADVALLERLQSRKRRCKRTEYRCCGKLSAVALNWQDSCLMRARIYACTVTVPVHTATQTMNRRTAPESTMAPRYTTLGVNGAPGSVYADTKHRRVCRWGGIIIILIGLLLVAALIVVLAVIAPLHRAGATAQRPYFAVDDAHGEHPPPKKSPPPHKRPNRKPKPPRPATSPSPSPRSMPPPLPPSPGACPHNGILAPLPGTCGNLPRASLCLDDPSCPTTFDTNLQCAAINRWTIDKTARDPPLVLAVDAANDNINVTDDSLAFTMTAIKNAHGGGAEIALLGNVHLFIINEGACNTSSLYSLLFLLEQSGVGSGDSFGPGGANHKLWAVAGSENPTSAGLCNTATQAQICDATGAACNVTVPFVNGTINDTNTDVQLDLSQYSIRANSTCSTGLPLTLEIAFIVNANTWAAMQNKTTGFRITALVTFDACCDRGAACGININCSPDGSLEVVRTVQVRSPSFALNTTCAPFCDCVFVTDDFDAGDISDPNCAASAEQTSLPSTRTCASTNISVALQLTCDAQDCACAGNGTYNRTLHNLATLSPDQTLGPDTCQHPLTGELLLTRRVAAANGSVACEYPDPIPCEWSAWSEWTPVDSNNTCNVTGTPPCQLRERRNRTIARDACHGGANCTGPAEEIRHVPCSSPEDCMFTSFQNTTQCFPRIDFCIQTVFTCYTPVAAQVCANGNVTNCTRECDPPVGRPCTLPCEVNTSACSDWSAWSPCVNGEQVRNRTCPQASPCPPQPCEALAELETRPCVPTPSPLPVPVPAPRPPLSVCTYTQGAYGTNCNRPNAPRQCAIVNNATNVSIGYRTSFGSNTMLVDTIAPNQTHCFFANSSVIDSVLPSMGMPRLIPTSITHGNCVGNMSVLQGQTLTAMLNAFGNTSSPLLKFDASSCPLGFLGNFSNVSAIHGLTGINVQDIVVGASILNAVNGSAVECDQAFTPPAESACDALSSLPLSNLTYFLDQYNMAFDNCVRGFAAPCFVLA